MNIKLTCTYISEDAQYAGIGLSEDDTFEATLNEETAKAIRKAQAILSHNPMFQTIEIPAPYLCDIVEEWGSFRPTCEVIRHCYGCTYFFVMDRKEPANEVEFEKYLRQRRFPMSTNNKKVILTSTPGPWRIEDEGTHFELLACDLSTHTDEWGIPIIVGKTYGPAAKANALLLASAPELLDIVRRFIEAAEDYLPDGEYDPSYSPEALLLSDAQAALAKAEGRQ